MQMLILLSDKWGYSSLTLSDGEVGDCGEEFTE